MRITSVKIAERAYAAYAAYAGAERLSAERLREAMLYALQAGDGATAVWRGERVIFLEGAYWAFDYEAGSGQLILLDCKALLIAFGRSVGSAALRQPAAV